MVKRNNSFLKLKKYKRMKLSSIYIKNKIINNILIEKNLVRILFIEVCKIKKIIQ